jgi:uncharacterized protein YbaR (Trm112 family)
VHLLLTDVLTCPRCGPAFGLILLADRLEHRHVLEGSLGCANCRERYPVTDGIADLRLDRGAPFAAASPPPPDDVPGEAYRLAALLGVTEPPGRLLLAGLAPAVAAELAVLLPGIAVTLLSDAAVGVPAGVDVIIAGAAVPLRLGCARGVAVAGPWTAPERLAPAVGRLAAGGRAVVVGAGHDSGAALEREGLRLLLDQEGFAVAAR